MPSLRYSYRLSLWPVTAQDCTVLLKDTEFQPMLKRFPALESHSLLSEPASILSSVGSLPNHCDLVFLKRPRT